MRKPERKPEWLRVPMATNHENYSEIKKLMRSKKLATVCEEAKCPNIHECWGKHKTATFMILGEICTRRCRFCNVKTGMPTALNPEEPQNVAESVAEMELAHAVITMVNRDDLKDGGASYMANTVKEVRKARLNCTIEVLTSDFMGNEEAIRKVIESRPNIFSHNMETVRRLTPNIRSRSDYDRSLKVLKYAAELNPAITIKTSFMLGLGETKEELIEAMDDLLAHKVQVLNLGQYLQPTFTHAPVLRFWTPEEFEELKVIAMEKGFKHCESAPLVRSSYHAGEQYEALQSEQKKETP